MIALAVLSLLALAYCVLDVATSRPADVRTLPKWLWFVVLLLPVVGPASWMLAGRPEPGARRAASGPTTSRSPDDDEEFLRQLRKRAEEQRRQAEMQRRRESDPRDEDRPA